MPGAIIARAGAHGGNYSDMCSIAGERAAAGALARYHMPVQSQMAAAVQSCPSCGASLQLSGAALSTRCQYCEAPFVDQARAQAHLHGVAPFRVTGEVARAKLGEYLADRLWAPTAVKTLRLDGRGLRGVLVPHWTYELVVRSDYSARVGIHWYRTETFRDSDGKTRTRRVQDTEWLPLSGTAARQLEDHLVSASTGFGEAESRALRPFDMGWVCALDPRFLAGFEAELPSIGHDEALRTATEQLRADEAQRIQHQLLPGDSNRLERIRSTVDIKRCRAVLLPVWLGTYRYKGKPRRLLVNGQTGQCWGDVPVSWVKVTAAIIAVVVVLALIGLFVYSRMQP